MGIAPSPQVSDVLHKILGPEYDSNTTLRPEQMSAFLAKTTGQIFSYEQIQWLTQHTEGWVLALTWVVDFLQTEGNDPSWDTQRLGHYLRKKSFDYFNTKFTEDIPQQHRSELLTLSLLHSELNSQALQALFARESIPALMSALKNTPWLTETSPNTWRFHPLFQVYLHKIAPEQLPEYKQTCCQLFQHYLDQDNPLAAEEILTYIPNEEDPRLSTLLFTLGEALVKHGHSEKALTYLGRASLGFGQINDSLGITRSLNAMGNIYLELGRNEEAEVLYQQIKQEIPPQQWNKTFILSYLNSSIPRLHINCLGEFELFRRDESLDWKKWRRRKALSILHYLILQPSHRAAKEELLDLFWPEESPEKASNSYHVTIHALRQALSAGLTGGVQYLGVERGSVYLIPESIDFIDVKDFRRLYQEGRGAWSTNPTLAIQSFQEAKKLYRGNLLDGLRYEEWLFPYRETLHTQYLEILNHLALHYTRQQEANTALNLWKELLHQDPSNEHAVREAMLLLHKLSRNNEALSLYKKLTYLLDKELDTVPEPQTEELYQNIVKNVRRDK